MRYYKLFKLYIKYILNKRLMITLIRHAESISSDKSRNVPISEDGKKQAKLLTGQYDLVICSTLKRSRQTLDESSIQYKNIIFTDLCRELSDGNTSNYYNNEDEFIETEEQIEERKNKFNNLLKEMLQKHKSIAVISHYFFLHKLCGYYFKNCHYWNFYSPE